MKRDFNLIRDLLLEIEGGNGDRFKQESQVKLGELHHLLLMINGGLISGFPVYLANTSQPCGIDRLFITMKGHDFLVFCRRQDSWDAVMKEADGDVGYEHLCMRLNWHDYKIKNCISPEGSINKTNL